MAHEGLGKMPLRLFQYLENLAHRDTAPAAITRLISI